MYDQRVYDYQIVSISHQMLPLSISHQILPSFSQKGSASFDRRRKSMVSWSTNFWLSVRSRWNHFIIFFFLPLGRIEVRVLVIFLVLSLVWTLKFPLSTTRCGSSQGGYLRCETFDNVFANSVKSKYSIGIRARSCNIGVLLAFIKIKFSIGAITHVSAFKVWEVKGQQNIGRDKKERR